MAIDNGYKILTCQKYFELSKEKKVEKYTLVNRVDIDVSVPKALRIADLFNRLDIKATFFIRLHANEYNPFSFENYRIIKHIISSGHEVGYHSEIVDQAAIWNESETRNLNRDISIINEMFNIKLKGVASHGGMTGLNNLDFWKHRKAQDYGLYYEAYDKEPHFNLFNKSFYISDSEWVQWKCYNLGKHIPDDNRSILEHLSDKHELIYTLIHPETYFDRHVYE